MAGRLQDKVAPITGTGGGQGRAAAELFAAEGAKVVGCDLNAEANSSTVDLVKVAGGTMTAMAPVDLGDSHQARQWVADAAAVHGRIDVLFNNAAAPRFAPLAELTDEAWHLHDPQRARPDLLRDAGSMALPHRRRVIVNTASVQGLVGIGMNGGLAHAAAKGGVIAMTRQLAAEGAPHGIRANCITPGTVGPPPPRASQRTRRSSPLSSPRS